VNNFHIVGLPDPTLEHEAVNLRTLNRKVLNEIRVNNLLKSQKYLRLDGQNQLVSDLQMNDHKIVRLVDATAPADGVNKRTLDAAVNSLRSENEQLMLATNENISQRVMFLDGTSLPENHQNYNDKRITKILSRISAPCPGGQTCLSEKHLKEFANHIHLLKMI